MYNVLYLHVLKRDVEKVVNFNRILLPIDDGNILLYYFYYNKSYMKRFRFYSPQKIIIPKIQHNKCYLPN